LHKNPHRNHFPSQLNRSGLKRKQIDPALRNRFTVGMTLRLSAGVLLAGLLASGCGFFHHAATPQSAPAPTVPPSTNMATIVTPDTSLAAKVVRYNATGRFVILSFPVGQMPKTGQTFFVYRGGLKVGQVKITDQQLDNDTVADLVDGEAQEGDDVREQ
jgi:hypothetical protein